MNTIILETKLSELEHQLGAADVTERKLIGQRLRQLIASLEPKSVLWKSTAEDDDLLFDNVPV